MKCQVCQFENSESAKYCQNCGEPLFESSIKKDSSGESSAHERLKLNKIVIFLGGFAVLVVIGIFFLRNQKAVEIEPTDIPPTLAPKPTPTEKNKEPTGKIVFTCQVDKQMNHDQICVINPDGSGWRQLTNDLRYEHYYASFSADGSEIIFSSSLPERRGFNIFIMNSDGSDLRQVTKGMGDFYAPALSPDGRHIITTRHVSGKNYITLLTREGEFVRDLNEYHDCKDPVWSPDGSEILFAANPKRSSIQFFVMNKDGSNVRQLTNMDGIRGRCDWNADGTMASYTGEYSQQNRELFLFGKNRTPKLITDGGDNLAPSFSPNGDWIVFTSYRDNFWDPDGCEIYIMRLSDGYTRRLTNNDYCDYQPVWGP